MASRQQRRLAEPIRWERVAARSQRRVDALLRVVKFARSKAERKELCDLLTIELETKLYAELRALGKNHDWALAQSRRGRHEIDLLR